MSKRLIAAKSAHSENDEDRISPEESAEFAIGRSAEKLAPLLLRVEDVAELLSLSERSVWRMRSRGLLPKSVRLGNAIRWRREEILAWVGAGCPAIKNSK